MGGIGSGGHNRHWRGTVEGSRRIDACLFQKHDLFKDGVLGTVTWTSENGETNLIHVFGGRVQIQLSYRYCVDGGPWRDVREQVAIDWSPRAYGGAQAYFLCPECGTRRRDLIGAGARFLCRACHGLVHASSRESRGDRVFRKLWKAKRKIGADPALGGLRGSRPKGMHTATHARFSKQVDELERAALDNSYQELIRIQSRSWRAQPREWARSDFWA